MSLMQLMQYYVSNVPDVNFLLIDMQHTSYIVKIHIFEYM